MITKNKTILKIIASDTAEGVSAYVKAKKKIVSATWSIGEYKGRKILDGTMYVSENEAEFKNVIFKASMWSLENPTLYRLSVALSFEDGEAEKIEDSFGFRSFECDEKNIYLNGYPFFMRAYIRGAAAHEHANNCKLSEYDFYKKNILAAKSYGFNTIRFHSKIPPKECFRAANELGILIHIEMRAEKLEYDNLEEMLYGKNDFVSDAELYEIIYELYNHPSFMVYCVGNEIREPGKKPRIREIRNIIKNEDPTRLFIDTCAHGEYDRDYVDFDVQHMGYFFPYGKNADMFENTDNLLCFGTVEPKAMVEQTEGGKIKRAISFKRPLIAHEVCHYTSWRDFYVLRDKFKQYSSPSPWWVEEEIKMIEAKGYSEGFEKTLKITKDFQFRCWKTAIEGIRASQLLSGFHMLQFADTDRYENSNGIVDCFDDPHGIEPEEFSRFNSDTVVLARLPKQIYKEGETAKIPVLLSQYRLFPPKKADFSYELKGAKSGRVYSKGVLTAVDTAKSGLYSICSIELTMPELIEDEALKLTTLLNFADGSVCDNSWDLWVFKTENTELADKGVIIKNEIDDELFNLLDEGKNVLLLYRSEWTRHLLNKGMKAPKYALPAVWDRFKGVIWDRGTINGGRVDEKLLNSYGFITDEDINFQYYPLIDDSDKINLDSFPVEAHVLVGGLDKSSRDRFDPKFFNLSELMYDRTMRHFAYVFSFRAGRGRLTVSGFNLTSLKDGCPASATMYRALIKYAADDSVRGGKIALDEFKKYLSDTAAKGPNKERMMTQYWQLDAEPVESMKYWKEAEEYLREDGYFEENN